MSLVIILVLFLFVLPALMIAVAKNVARLRFCGIGLLSTILRTLLVVNIPFLTAVQVFVGDESIQHVVCQLWREFSPTSEFMRGKQ